MLCYMDKTASVHDSGTPAKEWEKNDGKAMHTQLVTQVRERMVMSSLLWQRRESMLLVKKQADSSCVQRREHELNRGYVLYFVYSNLLARNWSAQSSRGEDCLYTEQFWTLFDTRTCRYPSPIVHEVENMKGDGKWWLWCSELVDMAIPPTSTHTHLPAACWQLSKLHNTYPSSSSFALSGCSMASE